jgi:hypothetical protein
MEIQDVMEYLKQQSAETKQQMADIHGKFAQIAEEVSVMKLAQSTVKGSVSPSSRDRRREDSSLLQEPNCRDENGNRAYMNKRDFGGMENSPKDITLLERWPSRKEPVDTGKNKMSFNDYINSNNNKYKQFIPYNNLRNSRVSNIINNADDDIVDNVDYNEDDLTDEHDYNPYDTNEVFGNRIDSIEGNSPGTNVTNTLSNIDRNIKDSPILPSSHTSQNPPQILRREILPIGLKSLEKEGQVSNTFADTSNNKIHINDDRLSYIQFSDPFSAELQGYLA